MTHDFQVSTQDIHHLVTLSVTSILISCPLLGGTGLPGTYGVE